MHSMKFYAVPHPIKTWNSAGTEEVAHAQWSDLFFDLIFVAVAYSVGHLLEHSGSSLHGFIRCFFIFYILTNFWIDKAVFFARFDTNVRHVLRSFIPDPIHIHLHPSPPCLLPCYLPAAMSTYAALYVQVVCAQTNTFADRVR